MTECGCIYIYIYIRVYVTYRGKRYALEVMEWGSIANLLRNNTSRNNILPLRGCVYSVAYAYPYVAN